MMYTNVSSLQNECFSRAYRCSASASGLLLVCLVPENLKSYYETQSKWDEPDMWKRKTVLS